MVADSFSSGSAGSSWLFIRLAFFSAAFHSTLRNFKSPVHTTHVSLDNRSRALCSFCMDLVSLLRTILAAFISFAVAGVLAWRKPDDWMALLAALALVLLVTANSTYTLLQFASPWQVPAMLLNILTWVVIFLVFCLIPNGRFVPR